MSRDYDEWCPDCNKYNARRGFVQDNIYLRQCLTCGSCYKEEHIFTKLKINGKSETAWSKAINEI